MDDESLNRPYFTVIIPTYNRPALLAQAVDSVVRQSDPDWELIIVDDASPVKATALPDPRIRLVRNDSNLGKSASLNRAFKLSRGQVVMILDDDDQFAVDRLWHGRLAHELAMVAFCGEGEMSAPQTAPAETVAPRIRMVAFTWSAPIPAMGAVSVARSKWVDFDPDLRGCEDHDWIIRLQERCPEIAWIDSPDWLWGRHEGTRDLNGIRARIEGTERLLEKHKAYYKGRAAAHAHRLYRLSRLHWEVGHRWQALLLAIRSSLRRPNVGATRLGARALVQRGRGGKRT